MARPVSAVLPVLPEIGQLPLDMRPVAVPPVSPALPPLSGAQEGPLHILLTVHKVVTEKGVESLVDAGRVAPGDVLEYRTRYKNVSADALAGIVLTLPLPPQTTLIAGSVYPPDVTASLRAQETVFTTLPDALSAVAMAARATALKPAATEPSAVNDRGAVPGIAALRWSIEKIAPDKTLIVGARVTVDGVTGRSQ